MSSHRKSLIAVVVLPVVLLLSLVTVGVANARQSHHPVSGRTAIATPTITIHSFTFSVPTSVLHGTRVRVVNQDAVTHTVTSNRTGKFNVSVPGGSTRFFRAPSTPTKYGFHCSIHPDMKGILKVR
jgi:plastocyanin